MPATTVVIGGRDLAQVGGYRALGFGGGKRRIFLIWAAFLSRTNGVDAMTHPDDLTSD
jgi:hypothetical protein